jgi:hypothetical protein
LKSLAKKTSGSASTILIDEALVPHIQPSISVREVEQRGDLFTTATVPPDRNLGVLRQN